MSTIHNPVNFTPSDYVITDYWDNQPPKFEGFCHFMTPQEAEAYAEHVRQERLRFERERKAIWPDLNDHRCQHCGQSNVRYVVAAKHQPTGKIICFGDICAQRLGMGGFDQFQAARIRALAAARSETHKKGLERERFLSTHPELKNALQRIHERQQAKDEGLSAFAIDLLAKFNQYGNLSDKQIAWAIKLADEVRVDKVKEARKIQAARSSYIGTVGERRMFTVEIKAVVHIKSHGFGYYDNGDRTLTIAEDATGNVVVYWNHLGEKGETVTFKATIKAHNEREGVKQTIISRAFFPKAK